MIDEELEYLKIRGIDIGIFIFGTSYVSKEGMTPRDFHFSISKKDIPALEERAKIIKSQGAKVINQINHPCCFAIKENIGLSPVVPSDNIPLKDAKNRGSKSKDFHELSDSKIKELIGKFSYAVELCIKSGYNGVEIHGAYNFLIQRFYSPHTSKRNDNWGGSDEKRINFGLDIVDSACKVREKYK
jgi:2,4-dienoyl-CoA reductase-like NADH-dependent reductase (Old Yellow Enzyme family)